MKCVECDASGAEYKCKKCGEWFCKVCAEDRQLVCACQPVTIEKVKNKSK